jgi:uncharacterized DUF497 family protein
MDESFEWDEDKNRLNQQKHDVSFELAQYAFFDPNRVIVQESGSQSRRKSILLYGAS